jgi:hypothetical protein
MYLARLLLSIMLLFKHLAGIFAIETLGCVGMANHMHFFIRIRPDVAPAWCDDETAVQCWNCSFNAGWRPVLQNAPHRKNWIGSKTARPDLLESVVGSPTAAAC